MWRQYRLEIAEVPEENWLQVIEARVPPRFVALNRQAFLQGRQAVGE